MGQTLQKLLINWSMFNSKKSDELGGTYLGIEFKSSFRNLMQRVEGSLNSTIEVLTVLRVMVFLFTSLLMISQLMTIYSLFMVSKRVRAIETKSENNNAILFISAYQLKSERNKYWIRSSKEGPNNPTYKPSVHRR